MRYLFLAVSVPFTVYLKMLVPTCRLHLSTGSLSFLIGNGTFSGLASLIFRLVPVFVHQCFYFPLVRHTFQTLSIYGYCRSITVYLTKYFYAILFPSLFWFCLVCSLEMVLISDHCVTCSCKFSYI